MENFLTDIDQSLSSLTLGNINQDQDYSFSHLFASEAIPSINYSISPTDEDDILLLPNMQRSASQLKSSNSEPTNIAGVAQPNGKKQDFLLGNDMIVPPQTRAAGYNYDIIQSVNQSGDNEIDSLIYNTKWNMDYLGSQITYSFFKNGDSYYEYKPGLAELNDTAKDKVRQVLNDLEKIIPIDFVEQSYSYTNPGIMVFMNYDSANPNTIAGQASIPGTSQTAGDVYLDNNQDISGNWGYHLVAHETGHALGLKHPGYYSKDEIPPFLPTYKDNLDWTIMSKTTKVVVNYQSLDIKALQYLYGKPNTITTPSIKINDISTTEGDNQTQAKFELTLDSPSNQTVQVNYQTVDGTAKLSSDYIYQTGTVIFSPGQTKVTIDVGVQGDNYYQGDRNFWVYLSDPLNGTINSDNGGNDSWGYCLIKEDDLYSQPSVKINDISITEGDTTKQAKFTISLDTPSNQIVTVNYNTVDGTGKSGQDYPYKSGKVTFQPGQVKKNLTIPVYGDNYLQGDRDFWVYLDSANNATINNENDQWGYCLIKEDDFYSTPSVKVNNISINEGDTTKTATFTVSLSSPATQTVKVNYQTIEGTAFTDYDYRAKSGTVTFQPGQKTKKVTVPVYGDIYYEGDRDFWLFISNPQNAVINDGNEQWGYCLIREDDF